MVGGGPMRLREVYHGAGLAEGRKAPCGLQGTGFMKDKAFKTYSQQLDALISDKGLVVEDREQAIDTLKRISYFALISGYKVPFRTEEGDRYKPGVTFDDVVALYELDTSLSAMLLSSILACERHLKAAYGYHFARKFGEQQSAYLDERNYNWDSKEDRAGIHTLVSVLKGHVRNVDEPHEYIEHYNTSYQNVPIWVLMHTVTFGELARMYMYAKDDLLSVLCTEFPSMKARHLPHVLGFLMRVRNTCAHTEPLYTLRTREKLPLLGLHESLGLVEGDGPHRSCGSGRNDPFGALVALRYFLSPRRFGHLVDRMDRRLDEHFAEDRWVSKEQFLDLMGFPGNWKDVATAEL